MTAPNDFGWVDLASRRVGGSVVAANDETFAPKENLLRAEAPRFVPHTFDARGQVYDGWETRRRRSPGHDWSIVRLGLPGLVRRVVVDTAFFVGNYPEWAQVEGRYVEGYPPVDSFTGEDGWQPLTDRFGLRGDTANAVDVAESPVVTHLRLTIAPDGGVARLRVLGEVVPDPRRDAGLSLDLAALENGGRLLDCSDRFYGDAGNVLLPGTAANLGDGWETRRRRDDGNDWLMVRLAGAGHLSRLVLDTTHFLGNAPGAARVLVTDGDPTDPRGWAELLPRTALLPDTPHWFRVDPTRRATHLRVDVYPDGGLARLRAYGRLTVDGAEARALRWWRGLPEPAARAVLASAGIEAEPSEALVADRSGPDGRLPEAVRALLL